MLTSSHAEVPTSKEAQKASGLPWSLAVDLLSVPPADQLRSAASFQRCTSCYGYANKYCQFERKLWRCSLCREENSITGYGDPERRLELPELNQEFVDFELAPDPPAVPAVLILVDITGQKPYLDTLKEGLLAAIEALSDGFLVGLATVGTKVGVFQLNSPTPLVKSIPLTHAGDLSLSFDEAFDFNQIFVPKAEAQKYFSQVADSFAELADITHAHCFGTAISAVVDYLTLRSNQSPVVFARVLAFLSSAPSYGLGAVVRSAQGDVQTTSDFYTNVATKAVKVGARIDLIGLGQGPFGFTQLRPLAQITGGNLLLYLDLQAATLPQDLYRQLSGHQGLGGILRLRTTGNVEQDGCFGNAYPSPSATNLVHIGGCDRYSSLVFSLRVKTTIGEHNPSTLQMAFAFFHVPPVGPPRRVLRVHTLQLGGAKNWHNLYTGLDPEVIGTSILQKMLSDMATLGISHGTQVVQGLLQDWVGALLVAARRHASWQPDAVDQSTGTYVLPSMEQIMRFCFALSRSTVLTYSDATNPDSWVATAHLLTGISRHLVRRFVCPLILPYSEALAPAGSCLPLSKLSVSVSPVLLLDALHTVVVLYMEGGHAVPFPPPKDSPLRDALAAINADRPMAPSVLIGRVGGQEQAVFSSYLLEDSPEMPYATWLASTVINNGNRAV